MSPLRTSHIVILFLSALVVRLGWMTTWSQVVFEGHEAQYLRAFLGESVGASTQVYPSLSALYAMLGQWTQDERALVVFSALAGSLGVVGAAVWVGKVIHVTAGLWTGVLVCLLPEHVAWSTSAYNVILPVTLLTWALAVRGRWSFLLAFAAVSMRVELVFLAPLAGLASFVGGLVGFGGLLLMGVAFPQVQVESMAFDINWSMVGYLGPPILLLSLAGLRTSGAWKLLLMALWVHAVGSGFDDYGSRHALLGGMALCGLIASARWNWIPVVALLGLGVSTMHVAEVWNADDDGEIAMEARQLGAPPNGCVEVTDEPFVRGQALPSHVRFFRGDLREHCVVWGEEFWHRTWNSRGLMDRGKRMRTLYHLTPVGALRPVNGGPVRLYHRLEKRW